MKTFKDFLKQAESNQDKEEKRTIKNSVIAKNVFIFKKVK